MRRNIVVGFAEPSGPIFLDTPVTTPPSPVIDSGIYDLPDNDNILLISENNPTNLQNSYPSTQPFSLSNLLLTLDPESGINSTRLSKVDDNLTVSEDVFLIQSVSLNNENSRVKSDPEPLALAVSSASGEPHGERFTTPLFYPGSKEPPPPPPRSTSTPQWELLYGVLETQPNLYQLHATTHPDPNVINLDSFQLEESPNEK